MNNPLLTTFLVQTYGSIENAKQIDILTEQRLKQEEELQEQKTKEFLTIMSRDQSISNHTNIPTKLKPNELNQKTVPHPNMNYDHSLTMDRKAMLREKYLNEKYKDNPQDKPSLDAFTEDWGEMDEDGDLPIVDI